VLVDDGLEFCVNPVTLGKQLVELGLPENAAERCLRELGRCKKEIFHLDDRLFGVKDPEIDDGIYLDGDVIPRNHILRRNIEDDGTEAHLDHFVHKGNKEDDAGSFYADHSPQPEDDAAFILTQDADCVGDNDDAEDNQNDKKRADDFHGLSFQRMITMNAGR
jgi:hypothetical protein